MNTNNDERQASAGQVERPVRPQPTNAEDAAACNENAIRRIAYTDGYADGVAAERERISREWDGAEWMSSDGPVDIGASIRAGRDIKG